MGYVFRVRSASFFSGATVASFVGLYVIHNDYKVVHEAVSRQMNGLHDSLDRRISELEKLKQAETTRRSDGVDFRRLSPPESS